MSNLDKNNQSNFDTALFGLLLDRGLASNLQTQLIEALQKVFSGAHDFSGLRLPSSRVLAQELSVSRTTVVNAYDQLVSEGYLTTAPGSGTFVAHHLSHLTSPVARQSIQPPPQKWVPFHSGVPDQPLFPHRVWSRHLERAWVKPTSDLLGRPDPFGWYPLRKSIADHLSSWRKLECRPEQVLITSGASEAFDIIFRGLLEPNRIAAVEDPGWPIMREALAVSGATVEPVRIDDQGLDAEQISTKASVAIVTPSRHYPTGISMPLSRRSALLSWAKRTNGLIVEDDYDSEFRYQGQPLPSLAGLDRLQRSVYLGSFSKLLSPALRIGYLVLPESRLKPARSYMSRSGARASLIPQPALATFMESGEFAKHLRRMRRTYAKRQASLVTELTPVSDLVDVSSDPSGMHLCVPLRRKLRRLATDETITAQAIDAGLYVRALSAHSVLPNPPQGLILGYAGFDEAVLAKAANKMRHMLRRMAEQ
ncbi:MAG: PLP-dependent aminotransferase family protein [Roseobacter sp.]